MNSNSTEGTNQNLGEKPTDIAAFRKSYPIDFGLRDDDGNSVLYIDDASGGHNHSLYLEILNTSDRHIELIKDKKLIGNYEASEEHHHFELKFRPGILAQPDAIRLKESENWNIGNKQQPDGTISLYLLHKNEQTTINVKDKLVLTLQQINASASGGARRTQVELKYKHLRYQGDKENFSGNRVQNLNIINHYGRKDIPLHVGFVSGDDILNDGSSSNELHLRIANTTLKEVSLKSIDSDVTPKFIISFDTGDADTNPWALGTNSQVAGIKVEVKYPALNTNKWETVSKSSDEGIAPQWEIKIPPSLQQLKPGEFFEVKLSDIITNHPSGHTNLYLRYENIPGYWDGQFVCSIEKTPILYLDSKVGIGTRPVAEASLATNGNFIFLPDGQHNIGLEEDSSECKRPTNITFPYQLRLCNQVPDSVEFKGFNFYIPNLITIKSIVIKCEFEVDFFSRLNLQAYKYQMEVARKKIGGEIDCKTSDGKNTVTETLVNENNNWRSSDINNPDFSIFLSLDFKYGACGPSIVHKINVNDLTLEVFYAGARPKNGYFSGKISAESIEIKAVKIGDIEITEKDLKWLKDNAK